jgi:hypothetical protein
VPPETAGPEEVTAAVRVTWVPIGTVETGLPPEARARDVVVEFEDAIVKVEEATAEDVDPETDAIASMVDVVPTERTPVYEADEVVGAVPDVPGVTV